MEKSQSKESLRTSSQSEVESLDEQFAALLPVLQDILKHMKDQNCLSKKINKSQDRSNKYHRLVILLLFLTLLVVGYLVLRLHFAVADVGQVWTEVVEMRRESAESSDEVIEEVKRTKTAVQEVKDENNTEAGPEIIAGDKPGEIKVRIPVRSGATAGAAVELPIKHDKEFEVKPAPPKKRRKKEDYESKK